MRTPMRKSACAGTHVLWPMSAMRGSVAASRSATDGRGRSSHQAEQKQTKSGENHDQRERRSLHRRVVTSALCLQRIRVSTVSPPAPVGSPRGCTAPAQARCLPAIDHRPMHVVAAHPTQAIGQEPGTDAVTESIRVDGEPLDIAPVTGTTEDAVAGDLTIDRNAKTTDRSGCEGFGQPGIVHPPERVERAPVQCEDAPRSALAGPPQSNRGRRVGPPLHVVGEKMEPFSNLEARGEERIALRRSECARHDLAHAPAGQLFQTLPDGGGRRRHLIGPWGYDRRLVVTTPHGNHEGPDRPSGPSHQQSSAAVRTERRQGRHDAPRIGPGGTGCGRVVLSHQRTRLEAVAQGSVASARGPALRNPSPVPPARLGRGTSRATGAVGSGAGRGRGGRPG